MKNYFIKGACLALAISATSIFAPNASAIENTETKVLSSQEEVNKNLVKIDTSAAGNGELFVDQSKFKEFKILLDGARYIIEDGKLVKDETTTSNSIMPFASDLYNVTLKNGETHSKYKMVSANADVLLNTLGPAEKREVAIYSGQILLASLVGSHEGLGIMASPQYTGPMYFNVTNYSATTQTWQVNITF